MPVNCIFALHDDSGSYFKNTYITLLSLLENTSSSIVVHIIHDATIEHGKRYLEELCAGYGQKIEFHPVPPIAPEIVKTACSRISFAALYRLFAHELIECDKALYFDSDLIFQCDVAELDAVEPGDRAGAAVLDQGGHWKKNGQVKVKSRAIVEQAALSPETYFNSGVMLLNLRRLRQLNAASNGFLDICLDCCQKNIYLPEADQDLLNIFFSRHGGALLLDDRFNYLVYARGRNYSNLEDVRGKILHYGSAQTKPRAVLFPAQLLFWKYYAMSPWGGDVFEKMHQVFFERRMDFVKNYVLHPGRRSFLADYAAFGGPGLIKKRLRGLFGEK